MICGLLFHITYKGRYYYWEAAMEPFLLQCLKVLNFSHYTPPPPLVTLVDFNTIGDSLEVDSQ